MSLDVINGIAALFSPIQSLTSRGVSIQSENAFGNCGKILNNSVYIDIKGTSESDDFQRISSEEKTKTIRIRAKDLRDCAHNDLIVYHNMYVYRYWGGAMVLWQRRHYTE